MLLSMLIQCWLECTVKVPLQSLLGTDNTLSNNQSGTHRILATSVVFEWVSLISLAVPFKTSGCLTFAPNVILSFVTSVKNKILPLGGSYGGDRCYFLQVSSSRRKKKSITKTNKLSLPRGFLLVAVNMPDQSRHGRKTDSEVTKDTTSFLAFSKHVIRAKEVKM